MYIGIARAANRILFFISTQSPPHFSVFLHFSMVRVLYVPTRFILHSNNHRGAFSFLHRHLFIYLRSGEHPSPYITRRIKTSFLPNDVDLLCK